MYKRLLVLAGLVLSAALSPQFAKAQVPAFNAINGLTGNTSATNSFGSTFDVVSPITILGLGAFDSANDGFPAGSSVTVYIYNRDTQTALTSLVFTNSNHGTLLAGSSFRELLLGASLNLPAGFHGAVVADYTTANAVGVNMSQYTTNSDGGLISFPTLSGLIGTPATYPSSSNTNTYLAGTFVFQAAPSTPEPGVTGLIIGICSAGLGARLRRRRSNKMPRT